MKQRETITRGWEKEIKKLRKFFNEHKTGGNKNDYKRYKFKKGISDNRIGIENTTESIPR
jgi:CCR4-NOT transcriptional regulation complex NOT5 subunit